MELRPGELQKQLRRSLDIWIFEDKYEVCLKVLPISVTWIALRWKTN